MLTPRKLVTAAKDDVMVFENGMVLGAVVLDAANVKSNRNSLINEDMTSLVGNCENSESVSLFNNSVVHDGSTSYIEVQNILNAGAQSVESVTDETTRSEVLNSSTCSHDSRASKRSRRKLRRFSRKPPQYATIYLDTSSQGGGQPPGFNGLAGTLDDSHIPLPVPVPQRSIAETCANGRLQLRLFRVPSVPFVIGILALGGVACTLGGIVLGSTGLVEQSTQYLSAALLMIGIGVSLLVISGAIWKLTIGEETEGCSCCRHIDTCRNCNSNFCNNRFLSSGHYIYPEFQHRTPPPSYLTSSNECALGFFVRNGSHYGRNSVQIITPPPSYRSCSTNSLSAYMPGHSLMEVHQQMYKSEASDSSGKEPTYVEIE